MTHSGDREKPGEVFKRLGQLLSTSMSSARLGFTAWAASMNTAAQQAAAAEQARVAARQLGLADEKAEAIVAAALERARTTPMPLDWDAVRADMVEAATGFPYRDGRVVLPGSHRDAE